MDLNPAMESQVFIATLIIHIHANNLMVLIVAQLMEKCVQKIIN